MFNKKIISAALALTIAASMSLCSCGNSGSDAEENSAPAPETTAAPAPTPDDEGNGGEQAPAERASAEQYADELFNGIEYVDQLNPISPEMVEKVYGIAQDKYTSGKVYVGGMSTAEEIACFDAVDEAAAADIKTALEKRIASQIEAVEGYNPNELPKLNDPVLVQNGNSVYMCLSNDNAKAKEIIG